MPLPLAFALLGTSPWAMPDWHALFAVDVPLLEIFVRGSVLYLGLFTLLRVVLKRESGALGITDVLVVVLLADAAQNAMAGEYRSISAGLLLVGTILFWSWFLTWLAFRYPRVRRFMDPPPLLLVKDGKLLWRNLRRELITEEEIQSQLRQHDVKDIAEVSEARMEGDGRISVVTREGKGGPSDPPRRT